MKKYLSLYIYERLLSVIHRWWNARVSVSIVNLNLDAPLRKYILSLIIRSKKSNIKMLQNYTNYIYKMYTRKDRKQWEKKEFRHKNAVALFILIQSRAFAPKHCIVNDEHLLWNSIAFDKWNSHYYFNTCTSPLRLIATQPTSTVYKWIYIVEENANYHRLSNDTELRRIYPNNTFPRTCRQDFIQVEAYVGTKYIIYASQKRIYATYLPTLLKTCRKNHAHIHTYIVNVTHSQSSNPIARIFREAQ